MRLDRHDEPPAPDRSHPPERGEAAWQPLGLHRFRIEHDTLRWVPQGEISESEGDYISDRVVELAQAHGYVLVLIDGRNSLPLRYEVRRLYVDKIRRYQVRIAVAVHGGKVASRAVAMLTFRAARLISGLDIEMLYTATEAEARRFLEEQRARLVGGL